MEQGSDAISLELVESLASLLIKLLLSRSLFMIHHALAVEAASTFLFFA